MGSVSKRELINLASLASKLLQAAVPRATGGTAEPTLVAGISKRLMHSSGTVCSQSAASPATSADQRAAPKEGELYLEDCCFKELELVGVGYRASVSERDLVMNLGYSHPVVLKIPEGLTVKVERNIRVTVAGYNRELIGRFCANIRDQRRPEPYKGKGIRYGEEVIVKKVGKKK